MEMRIWELWKTWVEMKVLQVVADIGMSGNECVQVVADRSEDDDFSIIKPLVLA